MIKLLKSSELFFVVFITGALVLVLEIVAVRILSPFFGNTIFTFSSVIGVVLAALSLGYYLGGLFSDKKPSFLFFYGIIFASGISVFILQILKVTTLPSVSKLGIISGPLVSSIILFFVPSFLLGTISPFAIKLLKTERPKEGTGSSAGKIFFWSTLGSILGTLLAGFVFIPRLGLSQITIGVGIILTILGLVPLLFYWRSRNLLLLGIIAIGSILGVSFFKQERDSSIIFQSNGVYEQISIHEFKNEWTRPFRLLEQDFSPSGAVYLDTGESVFNYSKYYSLYEVLNPNVEKTLILGGGAYVIPSAVIKEIPETRVDVVEIEPELYGLAKEYFLLPESNRLFNHIKDARRFLAEGNKHYDLIFNDVFHTIISVPAHLTTKEFFEVAKNSLASNGMFIMNVIGSLAQEPPSFVLSEIKTFRLVFPNSYIFAVDTSNLQQQQNIILLGYNSDRLIDFSKVNLNDYQNPDLRSLNRLIPIDFKHLDLEEHIILTDNYAPVDYMIAQTLKQK